MNRQESIFITGGASGLGRALALRFARAGYRVCIGDLNEKRGAEVLTELRAFGIEAQFFKCDVCVTTDLEKVAQWLIAEWGGLDVLVNNAGVAVAGDNAAIAFTDWQWLIDINLMGVVRGCQIFTPIFRRQKRGHIINIASMAGLVHPPFMAPYNAAKAAVVALSETLHFELYPDRVGVSVVCPSFFRTHLHETSRSTEPALTSAMTKLVAGASRSAESIAEIVFNGYRTRRFLILTDFEGRLIRVLKSVIPFGWYSALLRYSFRRMQRAHSPPSPS